MNQPARSHSLSSILITQSIAIVVFVLAPILITWMAPRTTVHLNRDGEKVTATATQHTLLFVPIHTNQLANVIDVDSQIKGARHIKEDRRRNRKATNQIADGSVTLLGETSQIRIQSTFEDAPGQAELIRAFLEDSTASSLHMTTNAPWMLTYVLGGVMTALAAFYVIGATLAILRFAFRNLFQSSSDFSHPTAAEHPFGKSE